jgi:hypothetical protein
VKCQAKFYKTPIKNIGFGLIAMLEVKLPAEIRTFRNRHMGLTIRQIVSIAGSLAVGVPLGVFGSEYIPADILMWVIIIAVAPIAAWGFAKFKGMRFEEFVVILFKFHFLPQKRVYEDSDVNYFSDVKCTLSEREIMRQRVFTGEIDEDETKSDKGENYVY